MIVHKLSWIQSKVWISCTLPLKVDIWGSYIRSILISKKWILILFWLLVISWIIEKALLVLLKLGLVVLWILLGLILILILFQLLMWIKRLISLLMHLIRLRLRLLIVLEKWTCVFVWVLITLEKWRLVFLRTWKTKIIPDVLLLIMRCYRLWVETRLTEFNVWCGFLVLDLILLTPIHLITYHSCAIEILTLLLVHRLALLVLNLIRLLLRFFLNILLI